MKKKLLLLMTVMLLVSAIFSLASCDHPDQTDDDPSQTTSSIAQTEADTTSADENETTSGNTNETPDSTTTAPGSTTETPDSTTEAPDSTTEGTVDTTPEPNRGTKIKVTYEINNQYAASIYGEISQIVYYGMTSTSEVYVVPKLGYKFVGWSDGLESESRSADCPKTNTTYTAMFEYDALELPILSLFTDSGNDVTDKENYVPGTISIYNAPEGFNFENLAMEIRGRGNYTWGSTFNSDPMHNKRPYRIKLSEKQNLLGQGNGKAKSWVLIANHCDQSLLRNQTVMNFARTLTGIVWEPSATSVEVFLNGEYIGVYMLSEQVQVNKNRINISEEYETSAQIDFLVQRSGYAESPRFDYAGEPYEIVNDLSADTNLANQQYNYIRSRISECWDAVDQGDQEEVLSLIDINSVIDTLIVHELFKNLDTGWDNFYMFATVEGKLYFGPVWDFDQCGGNADVGTETTYGLHGSNNNAWYRQFLELDWFKEMLQARWDELYKEAIPAIPDFIRAQAEDGYNAYCRNFERWKILAYTENGRLVLGYKINRETEPVRRLQTYTEHVEYFANWMAERMVWMNNYYHSPEFLAQKAELMLSGLGTAASPYLVTSAEDFYNFTLMLLQGETFEGKYFKQTADIDMTSISFYTGVGAPNVFAGIYDGTGHKIHANIQGSDTSFFPYLKGTLMNLMTTGSISNNGHAGGIARSVRIGGVIINCGSTVTLTATGGNAGGLVPSNESGGGSIIGCWFGGYINTPNQIGPLNVYVDGRTFGTIQNNYYIATFCPESILGGATVRGGETEVTSNRLALQHMIFNRDLETVAALAREAGVNIQASSLCSWESVNGMPVLVAK